MFKAQEGRNTYMRASKMTSQRTGSWSIARRQLAKGDFGACERYIIFYVVARRELENVGST